MTTYCFGDSTNGTVLNCTCSRPPPVFDLPIPMPPVQPMPSGSDVHWEAFVIAAGVIAAIALFVLVILAIVVYKRKHKDDERDVILKDSKSRTGRLSPTTNSSRIAENPTYITEVDGSTKNKRTPSTVNQAEPPRLQELFPMDGYSQNSSRDSGFVDRPDSTPGRPNMYRVADENDADFPLSAKPPPQDGEVSLGFARGDGMLWRTQPQARWQRGYQHQARV